MNSIHVFAFLVTALLNNGQGGTGIKFAKNISNCD